MPRIIADMTETDFIGAVKASCQGRIMKGKLQALHQAAKSSIGIEAGAHSVSAEITFLIAKLRLLEQQRCQMNEAMAILVNEPMRANTCSQLSG